MIKFEKLVRHHAEQQALSLSEVERRCGWGKGQLTTTLKRNNPTLSTVMVVAQALGVNPEDLIK